MYSDRKLHILFFRPTPWISDVECSTKVLAKKYSKYGYDVTYLENPVDPLHYVKSNGYYKVLRKRQEWDENICIANTFSIIPTRDLFPLNTRIAHNMRYRFCSPSLKKVISESGRGVPDIIWTTVPGSGYLKKIFPDSLLLFHVIDYYPAFRGNYISDIERHDYQVADHVFLIGESMREYITDKLNVPEKKVTVLGQGVDLEKYQEITIEPADIANAPKPRAVWCGVTKKGDSALFGEAASLLQRIGGSLVVIGPECEWLYDLQSLYPETVFVLGSKPADRIPAYLKSSDLGLMLYDRNRQDVYYGQNPLKLYEYAAAGLPVISTNHREYEYLKVPVILVKDESDISTAFQAALENRDRYVKRSLEFASSKSWDVQVAKSMSIIGKMI